MRRHRNVDVPRLDIRRDVRRTLQQALRMRPVRRARTQESRARRRLKGAVRSAEEDAQPKCRPLSIGGDIFKKLQHWDDRVPKKEGGYRMASVLKVP